MASTTEAAVPANRAKPGGPTKSSKERQRPVYSIPVFEQNIQINSLQAQKIMERAFRRTVRSLYSIDAILRIIGDDQEADEVEGVINKMLTDTREAIHADSARLKKLIDSEGITQEPSYTHPQTYMVQISSPQVREFVSLVKMMDQLMLMMDTLWIMSVLDNKQRKEGTFQWQQRMLRMARRIVTIETRARKAAHNKGKAEEVNEALPPEPLDADQLDDVDDSAEASAGGTKKASGRKSSTKKATAAAASDALAEAASA